MLAVAGVMRWAEGRYLLAPNQTSSLDGTLYVIDLQSDVANLAVGDLVAFHHDGTRWGFSADVPWAKRLGGLPGESIAVQAGLVTVGGRPTGRLDPPAMARAQLAPVTATTVPAGHLYVWGEHTASIDSRYREFGFVPRERVLGIAHRLW